MSPEAVITSAEEVVIALDDSLEIQASLGAVLDDVAVLVEKGKALRERLSQIIQDCSDSDRLQVLLGLVDRLTAQIDQAEKVTKVPTVRVRSNTLTSRDGDIRSPPRPTDLSHLTPNSTPSRNSSLGLPSGVTSPSFSIADSDSDDSDDDLPMLKRDSSTSASTNAVAPSSSEPVSATEEEPEERVEGTPTENKKSSAWVEEEGEVFRRGVVFNVDDEDEDVSGEDLRKEVHIPPLPEFWTSADSYIFPKSFSRPRSIGLRRDSSRLRRRSPWRPQRRRRTSISLPCQPRLQNLTIFHFHILMHHPSLTTLSLSQPMLDTLSLPLALPGLCTDSYDRPPSLHASHDPMSFISVRGQCKHKI